MVAPMCPCNSTWRGLLARAPEAADLEGPPQACALPSHPSAEIVISHCSFPLTWLNNYTDVIESSGLRVSRVVVYSKCGRKPVGLNGSYPLLLRTMPNVGRNDQTYAHHIAAEYPCFPSVTFFLKDRNIGGWTIKEAWTPPAEMVSRALSSGFACAFAAPREKSHEYSAFASSAYFTEGNFQMGRSYTTRHGGKRWPRPSDLAVNCTPWGTDESIGGSWRGFQHSSCKVWSNFTAMSRTFRSGLRPMQVWMNQSQIFSPSQLDGLYRRPIWYLCLGGGFVARRSRIMGWPVAMWRQLSDALARVDNLEEGHFMERMWGALLGPQELERAEIRSLVCAASGGPEIYGILRKCKCSPRRNSTRAVRMLPHREPELC